MPVPHFPSEIWIRIFSHLDPMSLSSLSEVNQAFNKLATDESLFRHHLLQTEIECSHPAQLYRRLEALHYSPETRISIYSSARTELLCVIEDTLVLCDFEKSRLICFPSGVTVDIEENFESHETFLISYPQFSDPEKRHVILPGGRLGFFHSFNDTYFAVLDVMTGELFKFPLDGRGVPFKEIIDGKYVVPAGNNAEWIAYHTCENTIALVDWQTGELVREIEGIHDDVKYLMGECSGINGNSIIGLLFEEKKSSMKEVLVRGFDNLERRFLTGAGNSVLSVIRSTDTKTYIMITSSSSDDSATYEFSAHRREADGEKHWYGKLPPKSIPELRENGRVIEFRNRLFSLNQYTRWPLSQSLWVELDGDNSVKEITVPMIAFQNLPPLWFRRTIDGALAVITGKCEFNVKLVKIMTDGKSTRAVVLRRWGIREMISIRVVADHYIVAQNRVGKIIVLHFNWFCGSSRGVYACPGLVEDEDEDLDELGGGMGRWVPYYPM